LKIDTSSIEKMFSESTKQNQNSKIILEIDGRVIAEAVNDYNKEAANNSY